MLRALEAPVKVIAYNAGAEGAVIAERVKNETPGVGYDALNGTFVNMVESGIIDPAKVTRSALQNAASIAGMILTTETLIVDEPEEEECGGANQDRDAAAGPAGPLTRPTGPALRLPERPA